MLEWMKQYWIEVVVVIAMGLMVSIVISAKCNAAEIVLLPGQADTVVTIKADTTWAPEIDSTWVPTGKMVGYISLYYDTVIYRAEGSGFVDRLPGVTFENTNPIPQVYWDTVNADDWFAKSRLREKFETYQGEEESE